MSDSTGDNKDSSSDGSADAEKNKIDDAETAHEAIAGVGTIGGSIGGRNQWLGSQSRGTKTGEK